MGTHPVRPTIPTFLLAFALVLFILVGMKKESDQELILFWSLFPISPFPSHPQIQDSIFWQTVFDFFPGIKIQDWGERLQAMLHYFKEDSNIVFKEISLWNSVSVRTTPCFSNEFASTKEMVVFKVKSSEKMHFSRNNSQKDPKRMCLGVCTCT